MANDDSSEQRNDIASDTAHPLPTADFLIASTAEDKDPSAGRTHRTSAAETAASHRPASRRSLRRPTTTPVLRPGLYRPEQAPPQANSAPGATAPAPAPAPSSDSTTVSRHQQREHLIEQTSDAEHVDPNVLSEPATGPASGKHGESAGPVSAPKTADHRVTTDTVESYQVRYEYTHDALRQEIERYRKLQHEYAVLSDELAVLNRDKQNLLNEVRDVQEQRDAVLTRLHAAQSAAHETRTMPRGAVTSRVGKVLAAAAVATLASVLTLAVTGFFGGLDIDDSTDQTTQGSYAAPPLTTMPCDAGQFVVWLAADKTPEALANLGKQYELLSARSVGGGADPTLIKASQGSEVCLQALAHYSSPSPDRFHLWAGPFDTQEVALDWCHQIRLVGPDDACLARPTT